MKTINGKVYPMWSQFVERQNEWIGKKLQEGRFTTKITGIALSPNGKTSAWFEIQGEDFTCGGDVRYVGIGAGKDGWITFSGYDGHTFRIESPPTKSLGEDTKQ